MKSIQLISFLVGGILVSYIINVLLLSFSQSLGIRNKNDVVVRWSNESKPSLGGVSFFIVFIFCAFAYSVVFSNDNIFQNIRYVGLFTAGAMAFAMGLADDAYNTKPLLKLFVQILCGCVLVWTHSIISLTGNYYVDSILTVFWVILIMNSLNMLDNMDGITATVVLFILITCLLVNWITTDFNSSIWSISIISIIGAMIGFLYFNIHPSKLFMGDAGSQFIGLFVAFFGINNLWNVGAEVNVPNWISFFVVLVAFTPALVDTATVVINRLMKKQSPMVGGKDHTTHHLVYAGLSDFKVWAVFFLLGITSTILTLLMVNMLILKMTVPVYFFSIYFVIVFTILFRNTKKYKSPK